MLPFVLDQGFCAGGAPPPCQGPSGYGRFYFTDDWKPADRNGDSRLCAYGLDLEASWLIVESARIVGRANDAAVRRASLALVDHALEVGFDKEDGGVYTSGPVAGPVTAKVKEWWEQAEALVAFLNAYQLTGSAKYWTAFEKQARFVEDKFLDRGYGEWYTSIGADGRVRSEKAGPWKAQYHVTRALLEVISRLGRTL